MVETNRGLLPTLGRIGIVCGVAITFILGLGGTVYLLSLRNAEVKVPDILGKNYLAGEELLGGAGLNIRKRASRFAPETKPDTILDQSPRAGEMIKVGQTIAVVISRPPKEGESAPDEGAAKSDAETNKAADNQVSDNAASENQNTNKNRKRGKDARNKNADSKNGANVNNSNTNNRNSNNGNANAGNRNASNINANNRNASNRPTNANTNRGINNLNANKRPPVLQPPPFNSNGNMHRP